MVIFGLSMQHRDPKIPKEVADCEPALDAPREYVEFQPEYKMTSEVSMNGEQYVELANDPSTRDELNQAIYEKDWETIKRLKNRKIH